MNRFNPLWLAMALTVPSVVLAQGQAAADAPSQTRPSPVRKSDAVVQVRATIVELDTKGRTATLRGPGGRLLEVEVPARIDDFSQLRVGDEIVVRYVVAIAARIEAASKSGIRERVETVSGAQASVDGLPGSPATRTVEVLATVAAIDRKAGTATLRGAKRTITLTVPENVDLAKLKVGQNVRAIFSEAAVMSIERVSTSGR